MGAFTVKLPSITICSSSSSPYSRCQAWGRLLQVFLRLLHVPADQLVGLVAGLGGLVKEQVYERKALCLKPRPVGLVAGTEHVPGAVNGVFLNFLTNWTDHAHGSLLYFFFSFFFCCFSFHAFAIASARIGASFI